MKRSLRIDAIKLVASQLIVLHHLSLYAPMADWLAAAWPGLVGFVQQHGRLAVQPFLVIGGYLAAQTLGKHSRIALGALVWQRYLRLAPPLWVALALVVLSTWLVADALPNEDWLSALPSPGALLVQALLLQDVLGVPSISAGAWYVAIDLQLFAVFAWLAQWSARTGRPLAQSPLPAAVAVATVASIHFFSRNAALDVWAIYFFPAYGLGALVAWSRSNPLVRPWLLLTASFLVVDWAFDPRIRPLVALATAAALLCVPQGRASGAMAWLRRLVSRGSDISYGVFVCHFAVIVLVSGLWNRLGLQGLGWASGFMLVAWAGSVLVGAAVQAFVERAGLMNWRLRTLRRQ